MLSVNVQATLDYCIDNVMKRMSREEEEARRLILKIDKYRENYYKYYTGGNWLNQKEYDLSINTETMGEEFAADLIKYCLQKKLA